MADSAPQDDQEARKQALEAIAERRKKQLEDERKRREARAEEGQEIAKRQKQAELQQEHLAAANLEARNEFIVKKREERAERERERLAKLAEEERMKEAARLKEEQREAKMEYMGELHEKALRKKIANRREIIAHEEEQALASIGDAEHRDAHSIDEEEKRRVEHLEKEAKLATQRAAVERDKAKAMAGEKRSLALSQLKQKTFERENAARRRADPLRTQELQNARREASAERLQIDREYKISCQQQDAAFAQGEQDRKLELTKHLSEAHKWAQLARAHLAKTSQERRDQAHVRRVGEEQWLLGKDN